jgi:hypothetical protein
MALTILYSCIVVVLSDFPWNASSSTTRYLNVSECSRHRILKVYKIYNRLKKFEREFKISFILLK